MAQRMALKPLAFSISTLALLPCHKLCSKRALSKGFAALNYFDVPYFSYSKVKGKLFGPRFSAFFIVPYFSS
jgi:hypothetical protein